MTRTEKIKLQTEKVKLHIKENKKTYMAVVISVVGTAFLMDKRSAVTNVIDSYNIKVKSPSTHVTNTTVHMPARGHRGNVILCNENKTLYSSQNEAAKALDLSPVDLSRHLNGKRGDVKGHTFTNLGENLGEEITLAA